MSLENRILLRGKNTDKSKKSFGRLLICGAAIGASLVAYGTIKDNNIVSTLGYGLLVPDVFLAFGYLKI